MKKLKKVYTKQGLEECCMKIGKRHRQAIELLVMTDKSKTEIAETVNISRTALSKWLKDADFIAELKELEEERDRRTRKRIRNMVDKALDRQGRILDESKSDAAAASVASDVLDRAGFAVASDVNISADAAVRMENPFEGLTTEQLVKLASEK